MKSDCSKSSGVSERAPAPAPSREPVGPRAAALAGTKMASLWICVFGKVRHGQRLGGVLGCQVRVVLGGEVGFPGRP